MGVTYSDTNCKCSPVNSRALQKFEHILRMRKSTEATPTESEKKEKAGASASRCAPGWFKGIHLLRERRTDDVGEKKIKLSTAKKKKERKIRSISENEGLKELAVRRLGQTAGKRRCGAFFEFFFLCPFVLGVNDGTRKRSRTMRSGTSSWG